VIGGGIMRSAKRILPPLRDYVARYAHVPWGRIEILPAELGDRAALVGCDLIAREGLSGGEG
jgi:predicted NBD/HSP70 family sugar kinase